MAVKRRVRTIELNGLSFKISPMTMNDVEEYLAEGRKLLDAEPKTDDATWAKRTLTTVAAALNSTKENEGDWDDKRVASELDMPTVRFVYGEYMKMSGLVAPEPGSSGDIDFGLIRCRICTELKKSPDEVGEFLFMDVIDLLSYWYKLSHDQRDGRGRSRSRSQRARELGDDSYREGRGGWEDHPHISGDVTKVLGDAKHITCAKPYIQKAIESMKRGEKLFGEP